MHTPILPSLLYLASLTHAQVSTTNTTHLTVPALVTINNRTVIQCWRLNAPFTTSSTPGTVGAKAVVVSNATNLAYTLLPPRFAGGQHTAPVPQLVHFLSGLAHITLPDTDPNNPTNTTTELWLLGGPAGLLFATDTTGSGHVTNYPSEQQTVALVAPFEGGRVPGHEVLGEGGCEGVERGL